jgi:hypothetical protein
VRLAPACPDTPVYKELDLPQGNVTQLRADLVFEVGGSSVYVDVVVVNPAAASYVESQRLVPSEQKKRVLRVKNKGSVEEPIKGS